MPIAAYECPFSILVFSGELKLGSTDRVSHRSAVSIVTSGIAICLPSIGPPVRHLIGIDATINPFDLT